MRLPRVGTRCEHTIYGRGQCLRRSGATLFIRFDAVGEKSFFIPFLDPGRIRVIPRGPHWRPAPVSRTAKDDTKRGPLAYGKGHKQRAAGYEFWGRRAGKRHGAEPGKATKRKTHKRERRQARKIADD